LLLQLPFSIRKDIKRRKQLRYGRRLKGTERSRRKNSTARYRGRDWASNRRSERNASHPGQGRGATRSDHRRYRWRQDDHDYADAPSDSKPRRFRHRLRPGAGVHAPLLRSEARHHSQSARQAMPLLGTSRGVAHKFRSGRNRGVAVPAPQDKKGEFFFEIPQQIFAYLLRYGPTPEELIEWMSNPKEIDNRVARTEVANFIDASAPPQRVGVLASLSKVAKSLRLLPHKGAGNGGGPQPSGRKHARVGSLSPRFPPSGRRFVHCKAYGSTCSCCAS